MSRKWNDIKGEFQSVKGKPKGNRLTGLLAGGTQKERHLLLADVFLFGKDS